MQRQEVGDVLRWWRWGGGIALVCFLAAGIILFPPSFLRVREVVVLSPLERLSERELIRLAEVKKGDSILLLQLKKVREKLLRYPWVREVTLAKRLPGQISILVEEEKAMAVLKLDGPYLVNQEGNIFKKWGDGDPKGLPQITGLSSSDVERHLKGLTDLIRRFGESSSLKRTGLKEVRWGRGGRVTLMMSDPSIRVELGNEQWEERLGRLSLAWDSIRATSAGGLKAIDLSLQKRIIVSRN